MGTVGNLLTYPTDQKRRNDLVPAKLRSYNPEMIRTFVMNRVWEASQGKVYCAVRDNYMDYKRAYEGKFKNNQNIPKWRNRLYVRLSFKVVETLRAYFYDALFGRTPYVMANPEDPIFIKNAKNMEAMMQHEAKTTREAFKYLQGLNYALKHGLLVTRDFWNFQRGVRPIRQFMRDERTGFINPLDEVEKPYIKMDSPDFLIIDPTRAAPDPLEWDTDKMRYVVEELETDFDTLWNQRDFYEYDKSALLDLEKNIRGGFPASSYLMNFGTDPINDPDYTGSLYEQQSLRSLDHSRKRVNLVRYEGKLDMPGNQEDPRIYEIYIANGLHVISMRRNPYSFDKISYNFHQIIPKEDAYAGIGAIEPILTDQRILNILANIRLDSLHLLISPRHVMHKNSVERSINNIADIAPGGILKVKSLHDLTKVIYPISMPDQGFNTFHQFYDAQTKHAEETLAMHPSAMGALTQQKKSATEIVRSLESANARFLNMVQCFVESGYIEHIKKKSSMIQQLMEQTKRVKITGDPAAGEIYEKMTPWDIQGNFMFEFKDPTKANKEQEAQLWSNLLQVFAPYFQLLAPMGVSPLPFLKGVIESSPVFNKLDIAKSLPDDMPNVAALMQNENAGLEQVFAPPAGATGAMTGGTPPGGGMAPGDTVNIPQPGATTAGIANRRL